MWLSATSLPMPAVAQTGEVQPSVEDTSAVAADTANHKAEEETFIDTSQRVISENLLNLSRRVDEFFSGSRMMEESEGSYACLSANVFFEESGQQDVYADYCLKFRLPGTQRRWKLVIASTEENYDEGKQKPGTEPIPPLPAEETTGLAGLRYIAEETVLRHINFDAGVRTSLPLNPFARARFRRTWTPDSWLLRLTENLYWYKEEGTGLLSRVDVERVLGTKWYFRSTSEGDYRWQPDEWRLLQSFGVYKRVGKNQALNLEWQIVATARDNTKVDYYVYRLRYRIKMWREWFFLEVSPQLLYDRERDFEALAGLFLKAEIAFGDF